MVFGRGGAQLEVRVGYKNQYTMACDAACGADELQSAGLAGLGHRKIRKEVVILYFQLILFCR
jgi:hypothetical protein